MAARSPSDETRALAIARLNELVDEARVDSGRIACAMIHVQNIRHVRSLVGESGAAEFLQVLRDKLAGISQDPQRLIECSYDHFVLMLPGIMNLGHARLAAQKIDLVLRNGTPVGDQLVAPDFVLGIAVLPDHAEDAAQLLGRAEVALLAAEAAGDSHALFDSSQLRDMTQSWEFDRDLREAIHGTGLTVYYQPQVELASGRLHGVEALARWEHPAKGFISPAEFIPAAEQAGLIARLTDVILKCVMRDFAELRAAGVETVSINLSALDLEDPELTDRIAQQLSIWDVPAAALAFEITESCILRGSETTLQQLDALQSLGCSLSIDDFGTGYSSLSNFKTIAAHEIKIDGSFVGDIETDGTNRDIVAIALELARRFGLRTVAEGVETSAAAGLLEEMGCTIGQGYFYARPLPLAQLKTWCRER